MKRGCGEIARCALPPRIGLTRFLAKGQKPEHFGARRMRKWPALAVRRFLLYDVFLHELGHLQIVDEHRPSRGLRFAKEKLAQEFAMLWCRKVWSAPLVHSDPVHAPPDPSEFSTREPATTVALTASLGLSFRG